MSLYVPNLCPQVKGAPSQKKWIIGCYFKVWSRQLKDNYNKLITST